MLTTIAFVACFAAATARNCPGTSIAAVSGKCCQAATNVAPQFDGAEWTCTEGGPVIDINAAATTAAAAAATPAATAAAATATAAAAAAATATAATSSAAATTAAATAAAATAATATTTATTAAAAATATTTTAAAAATAAATAGTTNHYEHHVGGMGSPCNPAKNNIGMHYRRTLRGRELYTRVINSNCRSGLVCLRSDLPSAINFGVPASLPGIEYGYQKMGYRRKLYNKFAGCDCGEGGGYRKLYNKFGDCDCGAAKFTFTCQQPSY